MDIESTSEVKTVTMDTTGVAFAPASGPSTGTNTPTGRKTPVKPALKSTSSMDEDDDDNNNDVAIPRRRTKKKKKNRALTWDEAKIEEHDKLRGTRMKIDEPNTPFAHYDSGSETDASVSSAKGAKDHHKISWDALTNKLDAHAAAVALYPPSSPSSHGGAITDDEDQEQTKDSQKREMKKLAFREHRKNHYNEMELVRRFRQDHADDDGDDDDEDNDGDDENE